MQICSLRQSLHPNIPEILTSKYQDSRAAMVPIVYGSSCLWIEQYETQSSFLFYQEHLSNMCRWFEIVTIVELLETPDKKDMHKYDNKWII